MITRRSLGMSLIELLMAIAIVAVLSGGAYMAYADYIRDTKKVVARTSMRKFVEAIQAYNSDHARPYTTSSLDHLVGSYLQELPEDPWGGQYMVDYFFLRVISAGEDGILDTMCPYHPYHQLARTDPLSDDIVVEYGQSGRISFVRNGQAMMMDADGKSSGVLVSAGVRDAAAVANGSLMLYAVAGGDLTFIRMTAGSYDVVNKYPPYPPGVSPYPAAVWNGHGIAWSYDAVRFAYICQKTATGESAVVVDETTGSNAPFIVCTAPEAGVTFNDVCFSGDGSRLLVTMHGVAKYEDRIYMARAVEGSTLTTAAVISGAAGALRHVAWSKDNRYIACSDGNDVYLLRASTGQLLKKPGNVDFIIPGSQWPAFSPDSNKIAVSETASKTIQGYSLLVNFDTPVRLDDFDQTQDFTHLTWD